ncbi:MAG: GspE/PulE family protein [Myxococcota bacterium]
MSITAELYRLDEPRPTLAAFVTTSLMGSWVVANAGLALLCGLGAYAVTRRQHRRGVAELTSLPSGPGHANMAEVQTMLAELTRALRARAADGGDMIGFVQILIDGAIRTAASDIHIHPLEAGTRISFRVQGTLRDVFQLPIALHSRLIVRLKVVSNLVTYHRNQPQDGHFSASTPMGSAEISVSLLPTNHGETAVLRVARAGIHLPELSALGLPSVLEQRYAGLLQQSQGLVFVTGPTGSGKTTTLYASLGHILKRRGNTTHITTIEDPIEYNVSALSQTQVNPRAGLTFAQGLRSLLRQDPNVLMVGEIRDVETAGIAIQAGLTGHLILTTIHAESAAGVFVRLIEMGIEPFMVASASLACVSQRLVPELCPTCRTPASPSPQEIAWLERLGVAQGDGYYVAKGCERCGDTGYLGRVALFELLTVTPALRDKIIAKVPTLHIHQCAVDEGMMSLLHTGIFRAQQGDIALADVLRLAG